MLAVTLVSVVRDVSLFLDRDQITLFYGPKLVLPFITSCFDSRITNVNSHLSVEWFENCWCKYYDSGFTVSYLLYSLFFYF